MFNHFHNQLSQRPVFLHTTNDDWTDWKKIDAELEASQHDKLYTLIAQHTGIPKLLIKQQLDATDPLDASSLALLHTHEQIATDKITQFQKRAYFQRYDFSLLTISRSEWLAIIFRFETLKRRNLHSTFFITQLSSLRRVSCEDILATLHPGHQFMEHSTSLGKRKRTVVLTETAEHSPFIISDEYSSSLDGLEDACVIPRPLEKGTPIRGYSSVHKTPGGTRVSALCSVGGLSLFKPLTPFRDTPERGRVRLGEFTKEAIEESLPKLEYKQAEPVEFTATLEGLALRAGKRRREHLSNIMGASAKEVFAAHEVKITATGKHSYHWSHLIAHFLGDASDVMFSDKEHKSASPTNLVPSTARANYNTLQLIEFFIRDKLIEEKADAIHIHVNPLYEGDALIPHELVYTLSWKESNAVGEEISKQDVYYIRPQSHERVTRSMINTVNLFREKKISTDATDPTAIAVLFA